MKVTTGKSTDALNTFHGLSCLGKMTYKQALNWGKRNMPSDLAKVGFKVDVFRSDSIINGYDFYRVNYTK